MVKLNMGKNAMELIFHQWKSMELIYELIKQFWWISIGGYANWFIGETNPYWEYLLTNIL